MEQVSQLREFTFWACREWSWFRVLSTLHLPPYPRTTQLHSRSGYQAPQEWRNLGSGYSVVSSFGFMAGVTLWKVRRSSSSWLIFKSCFWCCSVLAGSSDTQEYQWLIFVVYFGRSSSYLVFSRPIRVAAVQFCYQIILLFQLFLICSANYCPGGLCWSDGDIRGRNNKSERGPRVQLKLWSAKQSPRQRTFAPERRRCDDHCTLLINKQEVATRVSELAGALPG